MKRSASSWQRRCGIPPQNRFIEEVQAFHERIVDAGQYNALAQLALKLLAPGVPDIYQGQELWDYSLVDPDNRRPVNYSVAREALAQVARDFLSAGASNGRQEVSRHVSLRDPRLKLMVTHRLLNVRRRLAHLWSQGDYIALDVSGPLAEHVLALAWRGAESQRIELVAVVPRFVQKLIDAERQRGADIPASHLALPTRVWEGTVVAWPANECGVGTHIFTGQTLSITEPHVEVAASLSDFPIAVLEMTS